MPLYSIGSSLGFCTRSLTMKRISMPCPGRFQADQVDTQRIALAEGAAGAQQDAQAQGRQQAAEVRRQAHGFLLGRMCAHGATAARIRRAADPAAPMDKGHAHAYTRSARPRRRPPTVPRRLLGLRSVQRGDRPPARRARLRQTRLRHSTLFKTFPVTLSDSFSGPGPAKGNAAVYDALVGVGCCAATAIPTTSRPPAARTTSPSRRPSATAAASTSASVRWTPPSPTTTARPWKRAGWSPSRSSHAK